MSDAYGTVRRYATEMRASSVRPLAGGAVGSVGESLVQREANDERKAHTVMVRDLLVQEGLPREPPPPFQEIPLSIVEGAARDSRRSAQRAAGVGSLVSLIVSISLYIIQTNGMIIALTATISGVLSGILTIRITIRRQRAKRRLLQPGPRHQLAAEAAEGDGADARRLPKPETEATNTPA